MATGKNQATPRQGNNRKHVDKRKARAKNKLAHQARVVNRQRQP